MANELNLDLWRLAASLSVVDAAILIAGGDPSELDAEWNGPNLDAVQRTSGHPGYTPAFESLTAAIHKGDLRAEFAHSREVDFDDPLFATNRRTFLVTHENIEARAKDFQLARVNTRVNDEGNDGFDIAFRIVAEPDWSRTRIDVEDLKTWLRSRGFTTGFFFPAREEGNTPSESFMDPTHDHFAPELALAVAAWRGLEGKSGFARGSKAALEGWIDANPDAWMGEGELSNSAKDRIVTLANWRKTGGAPGSGA